MAADFSPGPVARALITVKPRGVARTDLCVVKAGSSIRGLVRGLATEDQGVARLENIVISLSLAGAGKDASYTTCESDGEFGFYNLTAGQYRVWIDPATLPENYALISAPDAVADLSAADVPPIIFRIEKRVRQLPVRKVFESSAQ
jgi:hypothetical protein